MPVSMDPSYSRHRDRINLGLWRSLYKGGGTICLFFFQTSSFGIAHFLMGNGTLGSRVATRSELRLYGSAEPGKKKAQFHLKIAHYSVNDASLSTHLQLFDSPIVWKRKGPHCTYLYAALMIALDFLDDRLEKRLKDG